MFFFVLLLLLLRFTDRNHHLGDLVAIVLISLGSINIYQSKMAARYATLSRKQHIPITRDDATSTAERLSHTTELSSLRKDFANNDKIQRLASGHTLERPIPFLKVKLRSFYRFSFLAKN